MTTLNVAIGNSEEEHVQKQIDTGMYESRSAYVRELIKRDMSPQVPMPGPVPTQRDPDVIFAALAEGYTVTIHENGTTIYPKGYWDWLNKG